MVQMLAAGLVALALVVVLSAISNKPLSLFPADTVVAAHSHQSSLHDDDHATPVTAAQQTNTGDGGQAMNACPFRSNCAHQVASNCVSLDAAPLVLALPCGYQTDLLLAMNTRSLVNVTLPYAPFRPPII